MSPAVFMYRAALHCESCGPRIMAETPRPAHVRPDDESSYDSDEWPKGPFPDGGGQADGPQNCDSCGRFLMNPLTPDGRAYLAELLAEPGRRPFSEHLAELAAFYEMESCDD